MNSSPQFPEDYACPLWRGGLLGELTAYLQGDPEPPLSQVQILARTAVGVLMQQLRAGAAIELSDEDLTTEVIRVLRLPGGRPSRKAHPAAAALDGLPAGEAVTPEALMRALLLPSTGRDLPYYVILGARYLHENGHVVFWPEDVTRLLNQKEIVAGRGAKFKDVSDVLSTHESKGFFTKVPQVIAGKPETDTAGGRYRYQFTDAGLTHSADRLQARLATAPPSPAHSTVRQEGQETHPNESAERKDSA